MVVMLVEVIVVVVVMLPLCDVGGGHSGCGGDAPAL